jgi:hypothetical protein
MVRNEDDYAAALDEFDALVLAEPGTPPGRRFNELVRLIDEYAAQQSGYALLPRGHLNDRPRNNVVPLQERVGKPRQIFQRSPA